MRIPITYICAAMLTAAQPASAKMAAIALDVAADFSPVYETSVVPSNIHGIAVVLWFDPGMAPSKATVKLIMVNVPSYPSGTLAGQGVFSVGGSKFVSRFTFARSLPEGRYRVDVLADDHAFATLDLTVTKAIPLVRIDKPEQIMPLAVGTEWEYETIVTPPDQVGVVAGPIRSEVTRRVVAHDADRVYIEMVGKNQTKNNEWMQLEPQGIGTKVDITTKTKAGEKKTVSDISPTIPLPLGTKIYKQWTWAPKDWGIRGQFQEWGPLLLKTPEGDQRPGYVFLQKITHGPEKIATTSIELDLIPGIGFVRQVAIEARPDRMQSTLTRSELRLKSLRTKP